MITANRMGIVIASQIGIIIGNRFGIIVANMMEIIIANQIGIIFENQIGNVNCKSDRNQLLHQHNLNFHPNRRANSISSRDALCYII